MAAHAEPGSGGGGAAPADFVLPAGVEVPTDAEGNIYIDSGYFLEDIPDGSQHMPQYTYTVTGARSVLSSHARRNRYLISVVVRG